MDEAFAIVVVVQGREYSFDARLLVVGYTHRFVVIVNELEVIFEPDEERIYRAILNNASEFGMKSSDRALIQAVAEKIQSIH